MFLCVISLIYLFKNTHCRTAKQVRRFSGKTQIANKNKEDNSGSLKETTHKLAKNQNIFSCSPNQM